jgi:menaquinone-dependent protoporphyrinogen oxidase
MRHVSAAKELTMRIATIYATREGQTQRIVEYLAGAFRARDVEVDIFRAKEKPDVDLEAYDLVVVAGSVHIGSHEPELIAFVKRHRDMLERVPAAFISVNLSQAGVEDVKRSVEQRARATKNVAGVVEAFVRKTGWHPRWTEPVAGALLYTRYNFLIRFIMKRISKAEGGSVDTSRDHEYTDWLALERFADRIIDEWGRPSATKPPIHAAP